MINLACRFILFIAISLILTSCGGGGAGSGSSSGSLGVNFIGYSGATNQGEITTENAIVLVRNTFGLEKFSSDSVNLNSSSSSPRIAKRLGSIQVQVQGRLKTGASALLAKPGTDQSPALRTDSINESESCDSGSVTTTGSIEHDGTGFDPAASGSLTLHFENCVQGAETWDGHLIVELDALDLSTLAIYSGTLNFPALRIVDATDDIVVSGTVLTSTPDGNDEKMVFNLVINDQRKVAQIKFENFQINSDRFFDPSNFIEVSETVSGRIFHSDIGYVDVLTQRPLIYSSFDRDLPYTGQYLFQGLNNSAARVTFISPTRIVLGVNEGGDAQFEHELILGLLDGYPEDDVIITDSDGDQMHDSWELKYDLNPFDESDALADLDNDGFSSIEEYVAQSSPTDSLSIPKTADLSLNAQEYFDYPREAPSNDQFSYRIHISNRGPDIAEMVVVEDLIPPEFSFAEFAGDGWDCNLQGNKVRCVHAYSSVSRVGSATTRTPGLQFTVNTPAENTIFRSNARIFSYTADLTPDDNSVSFETQITGPHAELIAAPGFYFPSKYSVLVGEEISFDIAIVNETVDAVGGNSPYTAVVSLEGVLPAGTEFVSASGSNWTCNHLAGVVSCGNSSRFTDDLNITVRALSVVGSGVFTISVDSDLPDLDPTNNQFSFPTFIGESVTSIQEQIDAASDGDTVLVPPGNYLGQLDLRLKNLILKSEQGAENTIIHGDFHIFGVIRLGIGQLDGFTILGIDDKAVYVVGRDAVIRNNVFDGLGISDGAITVFDFNNVDIVTFPLVEKNVFKNFDCTGSPNQAVINGGYLNIVNNLFIDNACFGVWLRPQITGPGHASIINNTFAGNSLGVNIYSFDAGDESPKIHNNLIAFNDQGISTEFLGDGFTLDFNNNLIFGNLDDYQGISDQSGFNGNISEDPLLIDIASGDLRPGPESPAIDTGNTATAPLEDFFGNARPQDGNGDFSSVVDIGAFEASAL